MPASESNAIRRTIHFTGLVQGVGFRWTAERVARDFAVTGRVRNLPDGRVELVTEGTAAEVDRFQQAVEEAMKRYIENVAAAEAAATGEFSFFRIAL
jgi:acylphosphatase